LNIYSETEQRSAGIATNFNTGWMHGDIKGAFLSDTDATNVTGTELLTNGEFTSNVSGWSDGSGSGSSFSWSSDGGGSILFDGGAAYANAYQAITTVVGNDYTVISEEWVSGGGGNTSAYIGAGNTPPSGGTSNFYASASTVDQSMPIQFTFTATSTTTYITIGSGWSNVRIGRISMRAGVYDRSVSNKGLQVFGTITKTPVATGAELAAYSGFPGNGATKTNYLEQPYNANLDFGTTFCFMGWIKVNASTGVDQHFFDLTNSAGDNRINIYYNHSGTYFHGAFGNGSSSTITTPINFGQWYFLVMTTDSSAAKSYLNGSLVHQAGGAFNHTHNADNYLTLGTRFQQYSGTSYGLDGSMTLIRLSKSIPSAGQIKKIYEDEKFLFQENAACTLYGSSDAVTALAYDEVTERLHVGTSSGRSEFQGLRRINNTTTAVTTAISAYDSFVVEQ